MFSLLILLCLLVFLEQTPNFILIFPLTVFSVRNYNLNMFDIYYVCDQEWIITTFKEYNHKNVSAGFSTNYLTATFFFIFCTLNSEITLLSRCQVKAADCIALQLPLASWWLLYSLAVIAVICDNDRCENQDLTQWPHLLRMSAWRHSNFYLRTEFFKDLKPRLSWEMQLLSPSKTRYLQRLI